MVSFDIFSQLDIRIGKVVNVEDHEKARKPMYLLTVDFGGEIGRRTIVAGIRAFYSKEELSGRKVVCVVNLDPKEIAGVQSQGMVLAAGEDDSVSLLSADRDMAEGTRVH